MGSAVLNRRMLSAGRLLVSYRTSGSLNRPLAALTSDARTPLLRKPLGSRLNDCFQKDAGFFRHALRVQCEAGYSNDNPDVANITRHIVAHSL